MITTKSRAILHIRLSILKKYVLRINNLVYYFSDEHVETISDSSKQVDTSNEPIK